MLDWIPEKIISDEEIDRVVTEQVNIHNQREWVVQITKDDIKRKVEYILGQIWNWNEEVLISNKDDKYSTYKYYKDSNSATVTFHPPWVPNFSNELLDSLLENNLILIILKRLGIDINYFIAESAIDWVFNLWWDLAHFLYILNEKDEGTRQDKMKAYGIKCVEAVLQFMEMWTTHNINTISLVKWEAQWWWLETALAAKYTFATSNSKWQYPESKFWSYPWMTWRFTNVFRALGFKVTESTTIEEILKLWKILLEELWDWLTWEQLKEKLLIDVLLKDWEWIDAKELADKIRNWEIILPKENRQIWQDMERLRDLALEEVDNWAETMVWLKSEEGRQEEVRLREIAIKLITRFSRAQKEKYTDTK